MRINKSLLLAATLSGLLVGCVDDGDNGSDGSQGETGAQGNAGAQGAAGANGLSALVTQTVVGTGSACLFGGIRVDSGIDANANKVLDASEIAATNHLCEDGFWLQLLHFADVDGNEATAPSTPQVWAEHSIWPQDPGFEAALEGGITTLHVLPGSANLFGGRSVTVKNVPSVTYQGMKFPEAPHGLKMACGENPKRVYGNRRVLPSTRMGNVAGWRAQWIEAQEYMREQKNYETRRAAGEKNPMLRPPKRDLRLETLAGVLRGEINVQHHCYRADEMAIVLDMAKEFGYKVTAFHHATEAYKISNLLAENNVCAAVWADWWGFKMESYDAIPENMVLVDAAPGGCAIVHSDSSEGIQRLNQEAAKGIAYARRMGREIAPEHAIKWVTTNAAKALSIQDRTGSIELGKMADVVVWNGNPFSVYAQAQLVLVDGAVRFDRSAQSGIPHSDFLLGQPAAQGVLQ